MLQLQRLAGFLVFLLWGLSGEELEARFLENITLRKAHENGMDFRFINRADYRDKDAITEKLRKEFPEALIVPEGGSNLQAVEGVKFMLTEQTKDFDYLCTAVGTGGTIAGFLSMQKRTRRLSDLRLSEMLALSKESEN